MSFTEDQLLPISALQHLLFCERQCALIHIERVWVENYLTIQGQHLHRRAHEGTPECRRDLRIARRLPLRSLHHGLVGQADVVEFEKCAGSSGLEVTPVEYKRGKPKRDDSDRVQLCAQALCLEEMLDVEILTGDIFYGRTRRRIAVDFDSQLRVLTTATCRRLHDLIASGQTPIARVEPKCSKCSLVELCMPGVIGLRRSAKRVVDNLFAASLAADGPTTEVNSSSEL